MVWISPSLPSRERGLKSVHLLKLVLNLAVAPFAGAWIEIVPGYFDSGKTASLPSRERGLKLHLYPPKRD